MDRLEKLGIAFFIACATIVGLEESGNIERARRAEETAKRERTELARKLYEKVAGPDGIMQREEYDALLRDFGVSKKVPENPITADDDGITIKLQYGSAHITAENARKYLSR
ncbi:MAG: hypothetical protein AABY16_00650 [Nanoarchaeota archaeon]